MGRLLLPAPWVGRDPSRGRALCFCLVPGANSVFLDLLQAYGLMREGGAEAQISLREKRGPLKISSAGKVVSWTEALA